MDRRFDRNADQLCQIMNHFRQIRTTSRVPFTDRNDIMLGNAITMLQAVIDINDEIARAAQKGVL